MKSIAEVETAVNKELQFGRLIHSPIVAWAFDMSRAEVELVPVAVGPRANFLKNYRGEFHLIPANPGFYQMAYVTELRREHFKKLTAEQLAEIRQTAGTFALGIWTPEDITDWREAALSCEEDIFDELLATITTAPFGTNEFCSAAHVEASEGTLAMMRARNIHPDATI
jgi:hypothetical protein